MIRRALTAILMVAATATAIGCTPAPSPQPTGGGPLAVCALVPDVADAVGREPIASPNGYSSGTGDRCLWVLGRDPSRFVGLTVGPSTNHDATITAFGPGEAVEGLGDEARWWEGNRTLSFVTREQSFQVDLQLDAEEATRELAEAIAAQVLASLEGP